MTEVMFILTTIFVAYVVYNIVNEKQTVIKTTKTEAPTEHVQAFTAVAEPPKPEPQPQIQPKPAVAASTAKKETVKPVVANTVKSALRDPNTGEVAAIANNYRFMKRWIKEALVAEGLLDKVYKNNELDSATEALIKQAVLKLESLEKYQS